MSPVEIKSYQGDGTDLAELTDRVWRHNFGGRLRIPLWDAAYFRWRLLDERPGGRDFMVCAYDDDRLIACVLGEPLDFEVLGRPTRGTMSSWLTVDPSVRSPRLALRLMEAFRKRHAEHGLAFSMGYSSSDPKHPARQFWDSLARRKPDDFHFMNHLWFWGRTFDAGAVSASAVDRFERFAPWVVRNVPWAYHGWRVGRSVRPYEAADLPRARAWIEAASAGVDVRHVHSDERLALQLGHPFVRTDVLERPAGGGLVNWYPIRYLGKSEIRVGMIDHVAGDVGTGGKVALLKSAGRRMIDEGCHAAFMMNSSAAPTAALAAAGFVPFPADVDLFHFFHAADLGLSARIRFDVLFG